jgi:hypothetical protein
VDAAGSRCPTFLIFNENVDISSLKNQFYQNLKITFGYIFL